jgi:2-polyprenyl-3-methyl-5-hydroxy-6-metoxy-1,4-benzoquinol methylase
MQLKAADLAEYVRIVDEECEGRLDHPALARFEPVGFDYTTRLDETLSPFSDEYFAQQIALYEEIAGRPLNQASGELHPPEIDHLIGARNPLGLTNPNHVAENVRALTAMLSLANLRYDARILDMGAGHGLSSEVFAFCGCEVHAVDIDPVLSRLAQVRSDARNLGITRHTLNFDDVATLPDASFDAAFFFQSLHHCLRPWELIATLKSKLVAGGVIAFAGEPVQTQWWKHWGIRLDKESLYVARKYGWFESGWSLDFISQCFARNGMTLKIFPGGHHGGGIGIATAGSIEAYAQRSAAAQAGQSQTHIGTRTTLGGKPAFCVERGHAGGYLAYGPYITLDPGTYAVSLTLKRMGLGLGPVVFDVVADAGKTTLHKENFSRSQTVRRIIEVETPLSSVEARVLVPGSSGWFCTHPQIERL